MFDAAAGGGINPGELWRHTSPYRGLAAMEETDSDYFFGRARETVEVLNALAAPDRLPLLIGNSGVGKSSLAQAGVLAALKRQAWPEDAGAPMRGRRFSGQPTLVLPHASARHRSAQGAGRAVPPHLAIRIRPIRNAGSSSMAGSSSARLQGHALRPARRHRAPSAGTRSAEAAGVFSSISTRARSFTCAPRSASGGAFPKLSRTRCPIRACGR